MGRTRVPQNGEGGAYHLGVSIPSLRGGTVMAASNPFHLLSKQGTGCQDRDVHRELPGSHCLTRTRLLFFLSFFPGGAGNQAQDSSRARSVLFQINVCNSRLITLACQGTGSFPAIEDSSFSRTPRVLSRIEGTFLVCESGSPLGCSYV